MKKIFLVFVISVILLNSVAVHAHGEETFAQAEEIIKQKISCDDLNNDQLEILGDYYMEQMHPGEQHEFMDEMMGGEGSESLKQIHINMGRSFYCGEHEAVSRGMMGGMMGGGMMNNNFNVEDRGTSSLGVVWWFGYTILMLLTIAMIILIIFVIKAIMTPKGGRKKK